MDGTAVAVDLICALENNSETGEITTPGDDTSSDLDDFLVMGDDGVATAVDTSDADDGADDGIEDDSVVTAGDTARMRDVGAGRSLREAEGALSTVEISEFFIEDFVESLWRRSWRRSRARRLRRLRWSICALMRVQTPTNPEVNILGSGSTPSSI